MGLFAVSKAERDNLIVLSILPLAVVAVKTLYANGVSKAALVGMMQCMRRRRHLLICYARHHDDFTKGQPCNHRSVTSLRLHNGTIGDRGEYFSYGDYVCDLFASIG